MSEDSQSVTKTVAVPADRLFALLVDPSTHAEIDGSGMVQGEGDGTVIVHTYDWSAVPEVVRAQVPFPVVSVEQMGASIDNLAAAAAE